MGERAPTVRGSDPGPELLSRLRAGDRTAFTTLFRAYRRLVWRVLHHLLGDDPELEDVVQATFLEVHRSVGSFEGRARLSSWIARVALHSGYRHLRRKRSRPPELGSAADLPEAPDPSPGADPELVTRSRVAAGRLHRVLALLPEKKRTVFILVELEGMAQDEVAEVVGCTPATVRTRLFYARRAFWAAVAEDPVLAELATAGPERSPR